MWTVVVSLCVLAYVAGHATTPAYAGCTTLKECKGCALDRCDPDREGNFYQFSWGSGICKSCCTTDCSDEEVCEC